MSELQDYQSAIVFLDLLQSYLYYKMNKVDCVNGCFLL